MASTDLNGQKINISATYPYRGISRNMSCSFSPAWQMYQCPSTTYYRMLIIESMDEDTEKRRLSPVAILSSNGYIDLINGPPNHLACHDFSACAQQISTFTAIVQSRETYQIFFSYDPPKQLRFRLINADSSIKCILAVYYYTLQQIDVYANGTYVPPTNRIMNSTVLLLRNEQNNVTFASSTGANFFNRLAFFS